MLQNSIQIIRLHRSSNHNSSAKSQAHLEEKRTDPEPVSFRQRKGRREMRSGFLEGGWPLMEAKEEEDAESGYEKKLIS